MTFETEQETFWQGEFGDEYSERNQGAHWVAANMAFFSRILSSTEQISSVLELGSNIGLNLMALESLLPNTNLSAVEINAHAGEQLLNNVPAVDLHATSILDFVPDRQWDFVFTKVVLIHIHPDKLDQVYRLMYESSSRYILMAEYYNPSPTEIVYRGHESRLFKRDFAGDLMKKYPDLRLVDYGFVYHDDCHFPQDDITWFLMEKSQA